MLTVTRIRELLKAMSDCRLLVIGDMMLDRYIHGGADRISPEAPVPVIRVRNEINVPGGAANVAVNAATLGARVFAAGVRGEDADGAALTGLLEGHGIDASGMMRRKGFPTIVKTRIMADRQQVARVDREEPLEMPPGESRRWLNRLRRLIGRVDGVILEDYGKGLLTQATVDAVIEEAAAAGIPVGFDPKDNHALRLGNIALATPNWREAAGAAGRPAGEHGTPAIAPAALDGVADRLMRKWKPRLLIMTLGAQGMYLAPRGGARQLIPTRAREVFDVSGAGDTVIATCFLALLAGAGNVEAAEIGNHAAGVVVGKLGAASCRPEELVASVAARERDQA